MVDNHLQELQQLFAGVVGHAYISPPNGYRLEYPCVVITEENPRLLCANNRNYSIRHEYLITLMYKDVLSPLPDRVLNIKNDIIAAITPDRPFESDGIYHRTYRLKLFN
jgi:hypothetical protein